MDASHSEEIGAEFVSYFLDELLICKSQPEAIKTVCEFLEAFHEISPECRADVIKGVSKELADVLSLGIGVMISRGGKC